MTKNQKITGAILGIIVLLLILTARDKDSTENVSKVSTSTAEISLMTIVLPETDKQTIFIEDGQGTYSVTPTAKVKGKVSVSDKSIEEGSDVISVVYQDPGGDYTYGWLVLFVKEDDLYEQKSTLFLGENVSVDDIKAVKKEDKYTVLVDMTSTFAPVGSSTIATIQNRSLSVDVRNSKFDQLTAQFLK